MDVEFIIESRVYVLFSILAILVLYKLMHNKYCQGINHIPGPFLASFTDFWRLFLVWGRRAERTHIHLHEKYGDCVRIGPKTILVADWDAVKQIYALNAGYVKSEFYPVIQTIVKGKPLRAMFNTTDEVFHAKLRRAAAGAYSMSNLIQFEPLVDSTIDALITQLESRFVDKKGDDGVLDFGAWLQYYAIDVIGELTFSKRFGFVDEGRDIEGIISAMGGVLNYFSVVGQMPWLDRLFIKNPVLLWLNDHSIINRSSSIVAFAKARMAARLEKNSVPEEDYVRSARPRRDFLDRFLAENRKDPEFMTNYNVLSLTAGNVFAGADTTAITLRAVFYFLLKHPATLEKLVEELSSADLGPKEQCVSWNSARKLPYLTAVIQESLRCHPPVGLPLERIVPSQGLRVNDSFIPAGTVVGATAWAVHMKESIFGEEPKKFRPERWLEAKSDKRTEMNNALFSFGMGARTCIGKNISLLEIYKVVPTLLRRYEVRFATEDSNWTVHNAWFVTQSGFYARINSRKD